MQVSKGGLIGAKFKIPDVYGVYQFKVTITEIREGVALSKFCVSLINSYNWYRKVSFYMLEYFKIHVWLHYAFAYSY